MKPIVALCLLILFCANASTQAQDDWSHYKDRTLKQIIDQHSEDAKDNKAKLYYLFTADLFPSRVTVVYTGQIRKISPTRKQFIAEWAKTRESSELVSLFEEELLFKEDEAEHWLPVQKQVIPFFAQGLKVNEKVELYLIWIGALTQAEKTDWFFLVNEFQKPQPAKKPVPAEARYTSLGPFVVPRYGRSAQKIAPLGAECL